MNQTVITKGRGGVQKGGNATTAESSKLDQQLKTTAQKLKKEFDGYSKGHNRRKPLWEDIYSGCEPDGGLWVDDKKNVRVAIEAKVQGNHGNAQERHAKNLMICESFQSKSGFRYVTFMAGEGAKPDGVLARYAKTTLRCKNPAGSREVNKLHNEGVSFFLSVTGWADEEIETLMRQALS
jgi:hypothetical protein